MRKLTAVAALTLGWSPALASPEMRTGDPCNQARAELLVGYVTAGAAADHERELASLEMRSPSQTPMGGFLTVVVRDPGIDLTVLGRYLLIVKDAAGAEPVRFQPDRSTQLPTAPRAPGDYWVNAFSRHIDPAPVFPLEVFVVDTVDAKRCKWLIGLDAQPRLVAESSEPPEPPAPTPAAPAPAPPPEPTNVGASCKTDGDCIGSETVCRKKPGATLRAANTVGASKLVVGTCAIAGAPCQSDGDCAGTNAVCRDASCTVE